MALDLIQSGSSWESVIWTNCKPAQVAPLERNGTCILVRNAVVPPSIILLSFFSFLHSWHETKRCINGTTVHENGT